MGFTFIAINLNLSQIVGHTVVYNLYKFQIDSLQIKIGSKFFSTEQ